VTQEEHVRETLRALFRSQRLAVLATHCEGQSYCSLVAFAATDDFKHLVFATARSTQKFANLSADPRLSLLIDSRSNRDADFHEAVAATVIGRAREVEGEERRRLQSLYLARHPHLEDFVSAPTCALLRVDVNTYLVVSRFQHVIKLRVTQ